MKFHAWRLVHSFHAWGRDTIPPAAHDGKFHRAGDQVVYAWDSSEAAAFNSHLLTYGLAPSELVWEKLELPLTPLPLALACAKCEDGDVFSGMRDVGVLAGLPPAGPRGSGQVILIDPDHHRATAIRVLRCQVQRGPAGAVWAPPRSLAGAQLAHATRDNFIQGQGHAYRSA